MSVLLLTDGCSTNYHYHLYLLQKTQRTFSAIMKLMPHTWCHTVSIEIQLYFLVFSHLTLICLVGCVFRMDLHCDCFPLPHVCHILPYFRHPSCFCLCPHANRQLMVISISVFSINHLILKCTGVIWKSWEDAVNSFAFILCAVATALYSMSVEYRRMLAVVDAASLLTR